MVKSIILLYLDYDSLFVSTASDDQFFKKNLTLQNKIIKVAVRSHRLARTKEIQHVAGILLFKDPILFNQLKFINFIYKEFIW